MRESTVVDSRAGAPVYVARYLQGIPGLHASETFPGCWLAERPRGLGTYLISSHERGGLAKPAFLTLARRFERESGGNAWARLGRNREWHLHHIVELRHCAELDVRGWLARGRSSPYSRFAVPCVLLAREEHDHYTHQTLGAGETPTLFSTRDPYDKVVERSAEAVAAGATAEGRSRLLQKVRRFRELYRHAYHPEPVLEAVARRVLDHLESQLRL